MIIESKISWTGKQLTEAFNKGFVTVDNPRQRGLCWKPEQKGLLIRSMIMQYPIPPLYAVKDGNNFDCIDGKQRITTIADYINDKYAIHKAVPPIEIDSGVYEISGKKFSELDEDVKDKVKDRSLDIHYLDNITDESEIDNIFCLLNNGTSMSKVFLNCAKTKCIEQVNVAADHEIFSSALSKTAINKYDHKDAVIKSWLAVNTENPSFMVDDIQNVMTSADISDESILSLWGYYNNLFDAYEYIIENYKPISKRVINKIVKPVHFSALIYLIHNNATSGMDTKSLAEWAVSFFDTESGISVDEQYNLSTKSGKRENVQNRHTLIMNHYTEYFKKAS